MTPKKQESQPISLHKSKGAVSGIILAGGLSTRLGRDKSVEPIANQTLLSRIHEKLSQITNDITVVVNTKEKAEKIPGLIRTKINLLPASIKTLRTIDIEGLDIQADGGTHVKSTSEVGKVKVVGHQSKGKSNKRIRIEIE